MAAMVGIGSRSNPCMSALALATKGPTSSGAMVRRSLRSAPAQKMPGVVERRMRARTEGSNRIEDSIDSNMDRRFLLKEFLA